MRNLPTNDMKLTATTFFRHMTDEDFIMVHEAGQLLTLCNAISLDLHSKVDDNEVGRC